MKKTKKYNFIAFFTIFILIIGLCFGFSNLKVSATGSINLADKKTTYENIIIDTKGQLRPNVGRAVVSIPIQRDTSYTIKKIGNYLNARLRIGTCTAIYAGSGILTLNNIITEHDSEEVTYITNSNDNYMYLWVYEYYEGIEYTQFEVINSIEIYYTDGDLYRFNSYAEMQSITFGNTSTTAATWGNLYIDDFQGYWDISYFEPGKTGVLFKMETTSETAGAKTEIILYVDYSFQDPDVILQFRDNNIKLQNIYIYSGGSGNWDFATANNELNDFMQSTNTVWTVVDYWGNFLTEKYPYNMPFYSFGSIVATIICNNNIPGVEPVILTNQSNFNNIPDLNSEYYKKTTEQGDDYYMAWCGWYYDGAYTLPVKRGDVVGKQEYNIYGKWTNEWMNGWTVGHKAGSNVDINDYIKKSDGTSWITAFFGAFSSFFAIKLGSVSLGAIILIPVSISVVWFVIKLFRGGS